eukprot:7016639-Prymnesium_polylepis.1
MSMPAAQGRPMPRQRASAPARQRASAPANSRSRTQRARACRAPPRQTGWCPAALPCSPRRMRM